MFPADPFRLLDRPWLPILRRSGEREWIHPAEVTSRLADDPVIAFLEPSRLRCRRA